MEVYLIHRVLPNHCNSGFREGLFPIMKHRIDLNRWFTPLSYHGFGRPQIIQITSLKTNMTGWKIPIFDRTYIFKWWMFVGHVSFRGRYTMYYKILRVGWFQHPSTSHVWKPCRHASHIHETTRVLPNENSFPGPPLGCPRKLVNG